MATFSWQPLSCGCHGSCVTNNPCETQDKAYKNGLLLAEANDVAALNM